MKILVVAFPNSIHTERWLRQIAGVPGFEVVLFPSVDVGAVHPGIRKTTVYQTVYTSRRGHNTLRGLWVPSEALGRAARWALRRSKLFAPAARLARCIRRERPDILHSLETQAAGYLVASVLERFGPRRRFPVWWHTSWGSDIYLFGRLAAHVAPLRQVLAGCHYFSAECERDVVLARINGCSATALPVYPNNGGFELQHIRQLRGVTRATSSRRVIAVKGYQGWSGRALVALRAISRARDLLRGYEVLVYCNTYAADIGIAAELLSVDCGIPVRLVPNGSSNDEILAVHGRARVSIGLGISDGISTSLLEAMAMGSFPIQSGTSAAGDWISDGNTGFMVPPEDPEVVEAALRRALIDDDLVDRAAEQNWSVICERADASVLGELTRASYRRIAGEALADRGVSRR